MRTVMIAALMLSAASAASIALAQAPTGSGADYVGTKPALAAPAMTQAQPTFVVPPVTGEVYPGGPTVVADGRAMGSDAEVRNARVAYRQACNEVENAGFCECVTAGVAQALAPQEVLIAARTISDRLPAQGDAAFAASSDIAPGAVDSSQRIEQVEAHYADACGQLR